MALVIDHFKYHLPDIETWGTKDCVTFSRFQTTWLLQKLFLLSDCRGQHVYLPANHIRGLYQGGSRQSGQDVRGSLNKC